MCISDIVIFFLFLFQYNYHLNLLEELMKGRSYGWRQICLFSLLSTNFAASKLNLLSELTEICRVLLRNFIPGRSLQYKMLLGFQAAPYSSSTLVCSVQCTCLFLSSYPGATEFYYRAVILLDFLSGGVLLLVEITALGYF